MPTVQEKYVDKFNRGKVGAWQALREACVKGWPQVAEAVLRRRPEMVQPDNLAKLHRTIADLYCSGESQGKADVIRALVTAGLDPETPGIVAGGPLMLEAWLDCGATPDGTGPSDRPLHGAIESRSLPDAALFLIDRGADVNALDEQGRTPLIVAAQQGSVKVAKALVARGADTLPVDREGHSAFRYAVEAATGTVLGRVPTEWRQARVIARMLADQPPAQPEDILLAVLLKDDARSLSDWLARGLTPDEELHGRVGVDFGPDMKPQERLGFALRELGISIERASQFVRVKDPGTDDTTTVRSSSLLYWAVALGAERCVKVLFDAGADPDQANPLGSTPRSLARTWRKEKILDIFDRRESAPTDPSTRAGRLGVDTDRLRADVQKTEERIQTDPPHWSSFRQSHGYAPTDIPFATELVHCGHVLEDGRLQDRYAEVVLFAAEKELSEPRLREERLDWPYLRETVLGGLVAAALLRRTDSMIFRLRELPDIPAPEPHSFVQLESEEHAAWLAVLLAKGCSPSEQEIRRIRNGRTVRPKHLLDAFEAIGAGDSKALSRSLREIVKLQRKSAKSIQPSALGTQPLAQDASAVAVMAEHAGVAVALGVADLDHLILRAS